MAYIYRTTEDWSQATWDNSPVYDLTTEIVRTYLTELFGNYEFFITSRGDSFKFWVPRHLKTHEKNALKSRGNRV
ncbi:hypothetical protein PVAG01_04407 [Phlyctema vagabunda]|uniref:Uncharacterized protein n=1 Tax=Phlyctema vagabunda TaxID=108571 RepID=A0ABR4PPA7_9HELO